MSEEAILVSRAQSGDGDAFDALVRASLRKVLGVTLKILRNEAEAWDVTQDAFVKAWRKMSEFRGEAAFSTWVCGIATRGALDRIREARPDRDGGDVTEIDAPSSMASPEDETSNAALGRAIAVAVKTLSTEERAVFLLHEEEGMKYREVAAALKIPIGTVMSRLHAARLKLQRELDDWWRETKT